MRDDFGIEARRVSLLASHSFNTLFRADLTAGRPIAERVGEVRIHTDGIEEVEAAWLDALHADRVVYFADTSRFGEYESAYGSMFVEAVDEEQRHLDALWAAPPHRPHLLHGDFGPQNVMRWTTQLTPIDFQDLQFGLNVQDVGITVADLRRQYADESLVEIFVKGYRSVRPWPLTDQLLEQSTRRGAEPERDQPRPELATAGTTGVHRTSCTTGRRVDGLVATGDFDLDLERGHIVRPSVGSDARNHCPNQDRPVHRLVGGARAGTVRRLRRSVALVGR